ADPPDALFSRRLQGPAAAETCDLKDDARPARDLLERNRLALRRVLEVMRVAPQHCDPRIGPARSRFEARDPGRDSRKQKAADRANSILPGPPLLHQCAQIAGQIARLLDPKILALDISRLALEQRVRVRKEEARVREPAGRSLDLGRRSVACIYQVVLLSAEC